MKDLTNNEINVLDVLNRIYNTISYPVYIKDRIELIDEVTNVQMIILQKIKDIIN